MENPQNNSKEQLLEEIKLLQAKITEFEKAETKQKEADEQLRFLSSVVEQSFDGMAIANLKGNLLFVNNAWARMHGYNKAEELTGKHLSIFHNKKQLLNDVEPFNRIVMEKGFNTGEVGHIRKDGTVFPTQMTTTVLKDKNDNPIAITGIVRDITYRKKSEEKLKAYNQQLLASEQQLRATNQQLEASEQQLKATNQQLEASNQQLQAANQQLLASEQQLKAANQQLRTINQQLKASEEKIKESENNLRTLFNAMTDIVIEMDYNGKYISIAPTSPELMFKPPEDIIGKTLHDIFPKFEADIFLEFVQKCLNENKINTIEYPLTIKNKTLWFEGRATPKTKNTVLYIAREITENKQNELALAEKTFMLDNILKSAVNIAIATTDLDFRITYYNPIAEKFFGYSAKEVIGKTIQEMHTMENVEQERLDNAIAIVQQEGEYNYFLEQKTPNGIRYLESRVTGIFNFDNKLVGYALFSNDITKRIIAEKNIHEQLLYSNALNELALLVNSEDKPNVILKTTTTILGETLKADRALIYNVDLSRQKVIGLTEWLNNEEQEIIPTIGTYDISVFGNGIKWLWENRSYLESHIDQMSSVLKSDGSGDILHNQMQIKSGLWVPFNFRENGFYLLVFNQVLYRRTWRKTELDFLNSVTKQINLALQKMKYLDELQKAKDHAEENDRLKTAFLQNISHEIRSPMNGILGFANLLLEPGLTGEDQHKYIEIIKSSGDRMLNTINDLMDISLIESNQMKVNVSDVYINEQIKYLYTFFKPEAEKKRIQLSYKNQLPDQEVKIKTDAEKIYAILTNLIKNAINYTNDGSIEFGYIKKTDREPAELEFFVKDTGIGIPQKWHRAIFDRFVQADLSLSKKYEGSGLGLSISKAYVEMLGGKIWVESKKGEGTVFYFTIPCDKTKIDITTNDEVESATKSEHNVKKLKFLIADDEEFADLYLTELLKDYYKIVLHAKNGVEAVDMCRNNPDIKIILMDIKMPEMSGYEATRKIREFNKKVIIIAQTAYALAGDREKAINAGCDDYISKPIEKDKLKRIIEKYL